MNVSSLALLRKAHRRRNLEDSAIKGYRPSLHLLLTLPYVALVLITAAVTGFIWYQAGKDKTETLSDLFVRGTTERISQAVDSHISGSEAVLETVIPRGMAAPTSLSNDLISLRERLWIATSIHRDPHNYAYYGDRRGHFIGLWRHSETEAELRLRTEADAPRSLFSFSGIAGELHDQRLESANFDPRQRPWYQAGKNSDGDTWTSIYIDFKTSDLVATRARRVEGADGQFEGVVATDMSLQHLNHFLRSLTLSDNGVAVIMERDGKLVATSHGPHLRTVNEQSHVRLNASLSADPLIRSTFEVVSRFIGESQSFEGIRSEVFEGPEGQTIHAGFVQLKDEAGLDWVVAVATPQTDFMQEVTPIVYRAFTLAALCCVLIVLLGLYILKHITHDLRRLTIAAKQIGDGDVGVVIPQASTDEIDDLRKSFSHLQTRLLTDRLTGIANREALLRHLEEVMLRRSTQQDLRPLGLLFLDLNGFKQINDRFGHDVGDHVLQEVSQRLQQNVRDRDVAARFGGDEFIVLLRDVADRKDAQFVANKLQQALARPYAAVADVSAEAAHFSAGASVGIAMYPEDGRNIESLLKFADESMYLQKPKSLQSD